MAVCQTPSAISPVPAERTHPPSQITFKITFHIWIHKVNYGIGTEIRMPTCNLHDFAPLEPFWMIFRSAYSTVCALSHKGCRRLILMSFSDILLAICLKIGCLRKLQEIVYIIWRCGHARNNLTPIIPEHTWSNFQSNSFEFRVRTTELAHTRPTWHSCWRFHFQIVEHLEFV
jgi:hypothetical protein